MFVDYVANLTVESVVSANRLLKSPVGVTNYRTNRERWAVALKIKGKTEYTVNGKVVLSDSLHPVIMPKGSNYSWRCIEPGECLLIDFDAEGEQTDFINFEVKDNNTFVNAFTKIEKALSDKKSHSRLECKRYLYEILAFILKSQRLEHPHPKKHNILKPAVEYIAENYFDSSITNDTLAKLCKISNVYFRRTFEEVYGTSPIKYLHNFRIAKAKAILSTDFSSIEQVAYSVGYNSIYHFSKMFKVYTGQTPSDFAKNRADIHKCSAKP